MTKRIILAGVLGGIAMFIWSFIGHDLLPLGKAGVREIPNEPAFLEAMKNNLSDRGLYMFPGLGLGSGRDAAAEERGDEKGHQRSIWNDHVSSEPRICIR